jgi:polyisoprenoid-binding protein YceI
MKRFNLRYLVLSALMAIIAISASAQQDFILDAENSVLMVAGTSSVHDWEMEAHSYECVTTLQISNGKVTGIETIDFLLSVENLESGKRIMDNKAHDALKQKQHPLIRFSVNSNDAANIENGTAKLAGNLEVAGKSRKVEVSCDFLKVSNETFSVRGKAPLKMTDFGIDPPSAMLGTLQTGDEITVNFEFAFQKQSDQLTDISSKK